MNADLYILREEQARARAEYLARRVAVRVPKADEAAERVFAAIGRYGREDVKETSPVAA